MLSYYQHIDSLPIWNFDKIQSENELRYLLKLPDYDDLPNVNKRLSALMVYHYARIVGQFKAPLIKLKKDVLKTISDLVIDIAENSRDMDKIGNASKILRALMIDPTKEEILWKVNFTETPEQRQKLTFIGIALKNHNEKITGKKDKKPVNLYEQQVRIESILGVNIDVHKCTVKQFMVYSNEARSKVNLSKNVN